MKSFFRISLFVVMLLTLGCASGIRTLSYLENDLNNYTTFLCISDSVSFKQLEFKSTVDTSTDKALISLINSKMMKKGLTLDEKTPDLLLFISSSQKTKTKKISNTSNESIAPVPNEPYIFFGPVGGYERYQSTIQSNSRIPLQKGSLIIEIFSRDSKKPVWIGIAKNFQTHISDVSWRNAITSELLDRFPY